ncbi:MAG: UDP-N-acetylmuramoyl-L-alanine--D-glutamate ligase [Deltaproteobacteria bacterium]|nr:UDP-N-acetylmuramoyl-L-alanine--D-glutamate ligase [Deltaproteobacteria bacterium]
MTTRATAAPALARDLPVLVVGLARTGIATARFLAGRGARVRAVDRRPAAELGHEVEELAEIAELRLGADDLAALDGIALVVPSPGVPADAPLLAGAVARGVPIASEIELAARHLEIPLLAVTGTNGKSTTTTLLGAMLRQAGRRPFVGGNLGTPLVSAIGGGHDAAVVEVSSFQLEWVDRFHPTVGIFLNLTDDHLDRYPDRDGYGAAKLRMFARQTARDTAVLNGGDPWIRRHADAFRARVLWFGAGEGAAIRDDEAAIRLRLGGGEEVYPLARVTLAGAHNRENMMAAIAAARAFGVPAARVQEALETFRGLEHRLELVRERHGVRWVNDSKGTNAGAVVKSLESFAGNVILLAGGVGKGGDYGVLHAPVARRAKHVVLFGEARDVLARALAGAAPIEIVDGLAAAVAAADARARSGDVVLLSPACASFDMFRDYADRGRRFKTLVEALP